MMKRILIIAILAIASFNASAQQDPEHTMYRFNGLMFNPAYAGAREALSLSAIYRWQWVKVPGAPQTGSFSVHSPLKNDHWALGLTFVNDRLTVTQTNKVEGNVAYRIALSKKKNIKLSIGLSAGAMNYRTDLSKLDITDPIDPSLNTNVNLWIPNVGFGLYAYGDKWFVGASLPHLLAHSLEKGKLWQMGAQYAHQYFDMYATAGYAFDLGKKVKFAPSIMMKYTPVHAPIDFDFNANFIFIDRIWLGASYRLSESYGFMGAVNITPQLRVGYAYDLIVNPISKFTTGTHEVMLGYDFNYNKKRIVNPRFVRFF